MTKVQQNFARNSEEQAKIGLLIDAPFTLGTTEQKQKNRTRKRKRKKKKKKKSKNPKKLAMSFVITSTKPTPSSVFPFVTVFPLSPFANSTA